MLVSVLHMVHYLGCGELMVCLVRRKCCNLHSFYCTVFCTVTLKLS